MNARPSLLASTYFQVRWQMLVVHRNNNIVIRLVCITSPIFFPKEKQQREASTHRLFSNDGITIINWGRLRLVGICRVASVEEVNFQKSKLLWAFVPLDLGQRLAITWVVTPTSQRWFGSSCGGRTHQSSRSAPWAWESRLHFCIQQAENSVLSRSNTIQRVLLHFRILRAGELVLSHRITIPPGSHDRLWIAAEKKVGPLWPMDLGEEN